MPGSSDSFSWRLKETSGSPTVPRPAQYFHLLRRQAKRARQRPLIIMTPKSLLRLPQATSRLEDLIVRNFRPVLDDSWAAQRSARASRGSCSAPARCTTTCWPRPKRWGRADRPSSGWSSSTPSPGRKSAQSLGGIGGTSTLVWVQEEPRNMGAWRYLEPNLRELCPREPSSVCGPARPGEPSRGIPGGARGGAEPYVARRWNPRSKKPPLQTVAVAGEGQG